MSTTNSALYSLYSAADRAFGHPVRLSGLAISPSVENLSFLDGIFNESIFKEARWKLHTAGTYREALAQLSDKTVPVVLSECRLPDGSWKDVLNQLAPMLQRPRLIVFSRHADERLWAEVLNLGGFDLLATPFRTEELVFAIGSAWLDWEGEQERRRPHRPPTGSAV
jgi:DNA-binding NtrC family response regulator